MLTKERKNPKTRETTSKKPPRTGPKKSGKQKKGTEKTGCTGTGPTDGEKVTKRSNKQRNRPGERPCHEGRQEKKNHEDRKKGGSIAQGTGKERGSIKKETRSQRSATDVQPGEQPEKQKVGKGGKTMGRGKAGSVGTKQKKRVTGNQQLQTMEAGVNENDGWRGEKMGRQEGGKKQLSPRSQGRVKTGRRRKGWPPGEGRPVSREKENYGKRFAYGHL